LGFLPQPLLDLLLAPAVAKITTCLPAHCSNLFLELFSPRTRPRPSTWLSDESARAERVPQVQSAEREDNGGAGGYENEGSAFTLQPPPDVALVRQILRGKPSLEIALLSRNDHQHHEGQRRKKRDQQAETVDPCCESELKERESEIDRIPAEGVRSGSHDDRRRKVARDGGAGLPERAH